MTEIWTSRLTRVVWGLGLGVAAKLLGAWGLSHPVFALLGTTSLSFVSAAALFGWAGLGGVFAAHAAVALARSDPPVYVLASSLAYLLAGALVYLAFRRVPGIGRGMPNLRSFQVYALASGVGGVVSSTIVTALMAPAAFWPTAGLWSRSTVVSVWLFGPPLLMVGQRLLARWLVPIPKEVPPRRKRLFTLTGAGGGRDEVVARLEPQLSRSVLVGGALILGVSLLCFSLSATVDGAGYWVSLLFLLPILWAARRHRLAGGLFAAAAAGLAVMTLDALEQGRAVGAAAPSGPATEIQIYANLLIFLLVGVLLGQGHERETELLEKLAESNQRLRGDLQRVVRALSGAVEAKDLYTEGHLRRVSAFAIEVGHRLGLGGRELEMLQIASALHDIGKIGIPEHILNKAGPLADDERRSVERHPEIGARILDAVEGLEDAAPLVRHHQERFDGRRDTAFPGYPDGISRDQIPLGARIIAVVDAFDAMTTDRAYRAALPVARAIDELRRERGRQFDPEVVDVFLRLIEERPWR